MSNPIWGVQPLEIYASDPSVVAGRSINFHVSVQPPFRGQVSLDIYRTNQLTFGDSQFGTQADHIYQGDYRQKISIRPDQKPIYQTTFDPQCYDTPSDYGVAAQNGCSWPSSATWQVPATLASGVYFAQVTYLANISYALFVVRAANQARASKILCQLSFNTYQAYNPWPDACFYGDPISQHDRVTQVSFKRPCQLWDYILYEEPIVSWLERNFVVEFCTNVDLHQNETLLQGYQLFISCGHDEYWSKVMRDRIGAFASKGGNVIFLSGNTCYRPVDYNNGIMTRLDDGWLSPKSPYKVANAATIGLGWSAGHWDSPLPSADKAPGYIVQLPSHWAFTGTGLQLNDPLGQQTGVIGYETDALWLDGTGKPTDPSPLNFVVLAQAHLGQADLGTDWWNDAGDMPGDDRRATFGLFRQSDQGVVANVGSTGWGQGLLTDSGNVHRVTANLVSRLRYRFGILYAITTDGNLLFYRDKDQDGTGDVAGSTIIGHGGWNGFKSVFSGGDGVIYAITTDGNLLFYRDKNRDGTGDVAGSTVIGHGSWNQMWQVFAGF
jgi:hypothetical protein